MKSNEMTLPCGCVFWNEGEAFVFVPHALDCEYYRYTVAEGKRQGKPMTVVTEAPS